MIAQRIKTNNVGKNSVLGRITTTLYIEKLEKEGYLVLNLEEQGCEELKSKAPGLYNKAYQQGKEDGRVQARESAEISARVKAKINETKKIAEGNSLASKKDFKTLMNEYQTEHKCTKLEALKACGKLYPEEFKVGGEGMKAVTRPHPEARPENTTTFETLVAKYKEEHKRGVTEAMEAIVKSHPNAHPECIRSRKENHNKMLKERQEKINATWALVTEHRKKHKCGIMEAIKAIQNRTRRTQEAY